MAQLGSTNIFGSLAVSGTTSIGGYQVFDSGSNSNGNYIRYADGTMECWGSGSVTTSLTTPNLFGSTSGTTYYNNVAITFPVVFMTAPICTISSNWTSWLTSIQSMVGSVTTTGANSQHYYPAGVQTFNFCWMTTGKWR